MTGGHSESTSSCPARQGMSGDFPDHESSAMELQSVFSQQEVEMSDGSGSLWEVVTGDGERIASCTDQAAAGDLAIRLNMAVTEWCTENEVDRQANC